MESVELRRQWERRLGLSAGELDRLVFDNPVARRATVGQATVSEVWAEVAQQLQLSSVEVEQLKTDLWQGGIWDQELLTYLQAIRPRLKTAVISDAWLDARENTKAYINETVFDAVLLSAEEGIAKPDPEIFRRALAQLHVAAYETIFIDDDLSTVEAARRLGFMAMLFRNTGQALAAFRQLIDRPAETRA